ncbi:MAG: hypothetical protein DIU68_006215 [Chloroflexota bacterium]|nr:MAG: hypothetical protein DIU68_07660 [Chloroflexota bacterium]
MVRPDRASLAQSAPLEDLLALLLRQFRRPLATLGIELTEADIRSITAGVLARKPADSRAQAVRDGLIQLVTESEQVLAQWNLTFEQAMETTMDQMPGWESTAEFLEIANIKSNAEIRIAAGAALVAALDDFRYAGYLLYLAARNDGDVDSAVARRVLQFKTQIDPQSPDWLDEVRARLNAG